MNNNGSDNNKSSYNDKDDVLDHNDHVDLETGPSGDHVEARLHGYTNGHDTGGGSPHKPASKKKLTFDDGKSTNVSNVIPAGISSTDVKRRRSSRQVELSSERPDRGVSTEPTPSIPRMVKRDLPFFQARNKIHIKHNMRYQMCCLAKHDWFHAMARWKTQRSLGLLLFLWTSMILVFAGLYILFDNLNDEELCRIGIDAETPMAFGAAFAFSLETCTTVGYGLPSGTNAYFQTCQGLQFIIYMQMVWSMMFNAFLFAFFYTRLGRSENRGAQVVFSRKALVSLHRPTNINDANSTCGSTQQQVRWQIRLYDVDAKHPVVEAHIRLYALEKQRPVPRPLRVLQPNDEMGGMLFLSFPNVVAHHIDIYSLLHPPVACENHIGSVAPSGTILRQVDGVTNDRSDVICPVCGESYGTHERWVNHVRYAQIVESKEKYPVKNTHLSISTEKLAAPKYPTNSIQVLKDHFKSEISEIIVVVEGIDPIMSGTFQALHSYCYDDIIWDANGEFESCLEVVSDGEELGIDLHRFHQIRHNTELDKMDAHAKQVQKYNDSAAQGVVVSSSSTTTDVDATIQKTKVRDKKSPVYRSLRAHDSFFRRPLDSQHGSSS